MNFEVSVQEEKIVVHVPIRFRRAGAKRMIVGPTGEDLRCLEKEIRKDEKLIKGIARAYKWQKQIAQGKYKTARDIEDAEGINHSYVQRVMRMMLLSPRIIEAILDGEQPEGFALTHIDKTFSPVWDEQATQFGFTFRHG
jgi:hypothetical protein